MKSKDYFECICFFVENEIMQITIDQIDLGIILYSGEYHPTYPEPWYSDEVAAGRQPREYIGGQDSSDGSAPLFMGWEGVYKLKFPLKINSHR